MLCEDILGHSKKFFAVPAGTLLSPISEFKLIADSGEEVIRWSYKFKIL